MTSEEMDMLNNDSEILRYIVLEDFVPDSFGDLKQDRYELAGKVAAENGREEPNHDDFVEGFRRLVGIYQTAQTEA